MEQQNTEAEIEQRIEQLKKITRKDGDKEYAEAQYELGRIYYEYKKDWKQTIEHLLHIKKQDDPEIYGGAQLILGTIYYNEKHDIEQAERYNLNVKKQDNPEAYALAQLYLGIIYEEEKDNIEQAERYYLNVNKQDNPEAYALAQLYLGIIYEEEKDNIEQAERHYLNVNKQDNPKIYALAQLYLGITYEEEKHNIEQAERYYLNVNKQDNPEVYAQAQLYLGIIYEEEKHNIEQAERYYLNVNKQNNPEVYAQAQFNLGVIYQNKQDIELAKHYYSKIEKQDNPEVYAQAQFNLGLFYQKEKNDIEKAEHYYLKIEKQDNPKVYAKAQFNLGVIYRKEKNDIEKAEHYYLKIEKQDNPQVYAKAQFNLGYIYEKEKQNIKQAEKFYLNIKKEDSPKVYAQAQIKLGDNVFFDKKENKLKSAQEYYQNVDYLDDSFEIYIIAQMMLSVISNENLSLFKDEKQRNDLVIKICNIRELTIEIQKELLVKFNLNESKNNDGLVFERQVAHYTKPEVVFNLLKNKPSDFRLNVVDFMNDPTENQVLTDWLGVKTEKDNEIKTFLASFSFNHNSLNQFRLYGNENNIVGSSVSVVFNQEFFSKNIEGIINSESINSSSKYKNFSSQQNILAKKTVATMGINVSNKSLNHKNDKTENDLNENSVPKNSETMAEKNITSSVGLLPLFRCLYFDPKNGYISIAKRNKYSFYLEHQSNKSIDKKWNGYLKSLDEKEKIKTIRQKLEEIELKVCDLRKFKKIKSLDQLIALALMPISCLVKHAAFEDEDECRMIYITNIADDLIQAPTNYAYANSLFVNYGKIEDYLEKIYLGPQCQPHHKLWITNHVRTSKYNIRNKPIKVVQSEMPLR